jgi:hypothetical protein
LRALDPVARASESFRAAIPQSTDKEMRHFLISLGLEAKIFHNGRYAWTAKRGGVPRTPA